MKDFLKGLALVLPLVLGGVDAFAGTRVFNIDAMKPGRILPNTSQTLVEWFLPRNAFKGIKPNPEWNVLEFAEYVEVMGATGGNPMRDCFRNPADRSVLDDYDFSRVVTGCRGIRDLGLKPYLKLGNVPEKFSSCTNSGSFRMNIRPPDDFATYGRYMEACAKALLEAFGREELLSWRFAVLTEYENGGWFKDASEDAEKTFQAYCRLYETTVTAFARVISPDLAFGVHSMTVVEGLWDERRFLKWVAERKLPIKFATTSFYDTRPGVFTKGLTLPKCIGHLRAAAESAGLTNLFYAVDEGRLLDGVAPGKARRDLALRIVGDGYQAAYDARIVRQLFDSRAEYFAAWGYFSGPHTWFNGAPSVAFYVAREAAKFKGERRLPVVASGDSSAGVETEAVAAVSPDGRMVRVMAYAFTNMLHATGTASMNLRVKVPGSMAGRAVDITQWQVDDDCNWFDEWRKDRTRLGIGDDRFTWSGDDPAALGGCGLVSAEDRKMFHRDLEPHYRDCARLKPVLARMPVGADGVLALSRTIPLNAALFLEIRIPLNSATGGMK